MDTNTKEGLNELRAELSVMMRDYDALTLKRQILRDELDALSEEYDSALAESKNLKRLIGDAIANIELLEAGA